MSFEKLHVLENHQFDEIHTIFWRNTNLNFNNSNSLLKSLEEKPNKDWLRRIYECEDEKVLCVQVCRVNFKLFSIKNVLNQIYGVRQLI